MATDIIHTEPVGKELGDDLFVGDEIDETDVFALDDVVKAPTDDLRHRRLVAHDLRHIEQCCLQGRCATRHQRCRGMSEKRIGLTKDEFYGRSGFTECTRLLRISREIRLIIAPIYRRRSGDDHLIVRPRVFLKHIFPSPGWGRGRGGALKCTSEHRRQVVFDLLLPTAGKQRDDGLGGIEAIASAEFFLRLVVIGEKGTNLLRCRVADIMDGEMMLLLIERHLERKDGEHLRDIALDPFDAPLFPRPYLR